MDARRWLTVAPLAALMITGCATISGPVARVALLAPFEGRYQEIGYNALYAVRLAIRDAADPSIELLPVDDGGTIELAAARGRGLADDPLVKVVITLGQNATDSRTQRALGDKPVLLVGQWSNAPAREGIFSLSSADTNGITAPEVTSVTQAARTAGPISGGDMLMLEQFRLLRGKLADVTVVSSGSPAKPDFRSAYRATGLFVPEPNLLAMLTYDAATMAVLAAQEPDASEALRKMTHTGLTGKIRFVDSYRAQAPIYHYRYDSTGAIVADDGAIE